MQRWAMLVAGTPAEAEALLQAAWLAEDEGQDGTGLRRLALAAWPAPADAEGALRLADLQRRAGLLAEATTTLNRLPAGGDIAVQHIGAFERARIAATDTGRHLLSSALRPPSRTPHVSHGKPRAGRVVAAPARAGRAVRLSDALDAFSQPDDFPLDMMQQVLAAWNETGPQCRALLRDYLNGADLSERTEQALFVIVHLFGEMEDTASFPALCRLAQDPERASSVLGDFGLVSLPAILISTFDGNVAALQQVVESPTTDDALRADTLLVLAFLARTRRFPEAELYQYLAGLPERLQPSEQATVWFGWARAVAALGLCRADRARGADFPARANRPGPSGLDRLLGRFAGRHRTIQGACRAGPGTISARWGPPPPGWRRRLGKRRRRSRPNRSAIQCGRSGGTIPARAAAARSSRSAVWPLLRPSRRMTRWPRG